MNDYGQLAGMKRLVAIYKLLEEAAMTRPWDREPYAVTHRQKGKSTPNNYPCRRAVNVIRWADMKANELAATLERRSENVLSDTVKCAECGIEFRYDGERKCILCR